MITASYFLGKLLPAYGYIALGFIARRWCGFSQAWVAQLLFFVLVPLLVLKASLTSQIESFLFLASLSFIVSLAMSLCAKYLAPTFSGTIKTGMLQCMYGYFNLGWFGIPIVYALYAEPGMALMTALYVGGMLFGNTVGYLLVTDYQKGCTSVFLKLLSMPALHAMLIGFALHLLQWNEVLAANDILSNIFDVVAIAISVFGMGLVGMSVAHVSMRTIAWRQLACLLAARLICAIVVVGVFGSVCWLLGLLNALELKIFLLFPLLPIAANMLVFTAKTQSDHTTEFIGVALLTSTILSCLFFLIWFVSNSA